MQKNLNLKVKFRESFRPFAPSVLREDLADWFDLGSDSPYMLLVAGVREDKRVAQDDSVQALDGLEDTAGAIDAYTQAIDLADAGDDFDFLGILKDSVLSCTKSCISDTPCQLLEDAMEACMSECGLDIFSDDQPGNGP